MVGGKWVDGLGGGSADDAGRAVWRDGARVCSGDGEERGEVGWELSAGISGVSARGMGWEGRILNCGVASLLC